MMFTQVMLFASVVMGATYAAGEAGSGHYGSGPSSAGTGFPSYGRGGGYGSGPSSGGDGFPSYGRGGGYKSGPSSEGDGFPSYGRGGEYGNGPSSKGAEFPSYYGGGKGYESGPSSEGDGFHSYGGGFGRGHWQNEAPKPYNFRYDVDDGQGNVHYRNEESDQNGRVRGTYGYFDAQGLHRNVEYIADENGFRASIKTNEPGVDGNQNPADVVINAEQPPAGIYESGLFNGYGGPRYGYGGPRYGNGGGTGGASGGYDGSSAGSPSGPGKPGKAESPHNLWLGSKQGSGKSGY